MLETETDVGDGDGYWKRDGVAASKDIAESPTAERSGDGTPEIKLIVNSVVSYGNGETISLNLYFLFPFNLFKKNEI